jgi:photosystem II stability/assembly factor-like uncharacterized protein
VHRRPAPAAPRALRRPAAAVAIATTAAAAFAALAGGQPATIPSEWVKSLDFRSVGPANMSGRITDLAVYEADPTIWYATAASGGLLKTTNGGTTYEHLFQHEAVASMGDVEVFQGNPDIVWVGTGEENPRNSSSWGNGVYKSTDGGKTWSHMGLEDSFQIGSIRIHPTNPDIVYVGALGRLWGPNEERGLFRTTDGGTTWEQIVELDENTGVIDIEMHPDDPDTLMVASYTRRRDGFDTNDPAVKFGPLAGIWRTTDGGDTFERMTKGLPTVEMGRIDIEYYGANPDVVWAIIETELIGLEPEDMAYMGIRGENAGEFGARLTEVTEGGPAEAAGLQSGDIIIRLNDRAATSYDGLIRELRQFRAGDSVTVEFARGGDIMSKDLTFERRPSENEDAEAEVDREQARRRSPWGTRLGGQRGNLQDEQGPDGFERGGIFRSADGGETWERINSLNPRPMYFSQMEVDPSDESFIHVGGISLHTSEDGGKTFRDDAHIGANGAVHVDHHAMWVNPKDGRHIILGNDGGIYVTRDRMKTWDHHNHFAIGQFYHITVDNQPNYRIYGGLQDNGSWGGPSLVRDAGGPQNEDWYRVGGGDGFICFVDPEDPDLVYYQSQNGGYGRINLRTGERGRVRAVPQRGVNYRFNWRAPYLLSPHNSSIYLAAGNHVFKSEEQGERMEPISPEISHTDRGAATALSQSARDKDLIYVGTDDGALWATWDGGDTWADLFTVGDESAAEGEADAAAPAGDRPRRRGARGGGGAENAPAGRGGRGGRGGAAGAAAGGGGGGGFGGAVAGRSGRLLQMIRERDADGDGTVSRAEAGERMGPMFDRLDTNGDGVIGAGELAALQARLGGGAARGAAGEDAAVTAGPDVVSGVWTGTSASEAGGQDFTLTLALTDGTKLAGTLSGQLGEIPVNGTWNAAGRSMQLSAETADFAFEITATVAADGRMSGSVTVGGMEVATVSGSRASAPAAAAPAPAAEGGGDAAATPAAAEPGTPGGARIDTLIPQRMLVSELVASRFETDRVYMTMDGHRSDIDRPFVFVSEDKGASWRDITANLTEADGVARVIAEDLENENVLWLGTEFGLYVTVDRGESWTRLSGGDFPTVAVHGIAQHERSGDVIIGTHGRSVWVLNGTTIRQMGTEAINSRAMLYTPATLTYWRRQASRGGTLRSFTGDQPDSNLTVHYSLTADARDVSLEITTLDGTPVRSLSTETSSGLHAARWDGRREGQGNRRRFGPRVDPGTYRVVLTVDGTTMTRDFQVTGDPESPATILWGEHWDEQVELYEMEAPETGLDDDEEELERRRDV